VIFVGMTLKGYSDSQGDDLTIFLRVNLSKTEHATIKITRGHGNNWEVFTNHQWKTNRNEHASTWGSKLTGFSVGHQRICLERYGKKQLDFITSGILALTIAGNILDLWINTLNKYSLDGSLTFLTYKWCIYILYIYYIYIYIDFEP
jgi:hypothetical protein